MCHVFDHFHDLLMIRCTTRILRGVRRNSPILEKVRHHHHCHHHHHNLYDHRHHCRHSLYTVLHNIDISTITSAFLIPSRHLQSLHHVSLISSLASSGGNPQKRLPRCDDIGQLRLLHGKHERQQQHFGQIPASGVLCDVPIQLLDQAAVSSKPEHQAPISTGPGHQQAGGGAPGHQQAAGPGYQQAGSASWWWRPTDLTGHRSNYDGSPADAHRHPEKA